MTLIELVLSTCKIADNFHSTRSLYSVQGAVVSEVGELAEEVNIAMGDSYKESGPDGIPGEAIDAILALADLLYVNNRNITEEELIRIAKPKLEKWIAKISEANSQGKIK